MLRIILNKKMKILFAEKSKDLISALMLVITHIKNTEVKDIGLILNVDKVDNLYKKLKKERPDVLIINGGFVDHKTREKCLFYRNYTRSWQY